MIRSDCRTICWLYSSGIELKNFSRVQRRKYDTIVNIMHWKGNIENLNSYTCTVNTLQLSSLTLHWQNIPLKLRRGQNVEPSNFFIYDPFSQLGVYLTNTSCLRVKIFILCCIFSAIQQHEWIRTHSAVWDSHFMLHIFSYPTTWVD